MVAKYRQIKRMGEQEGLSELLPEDCAIALVTAGSETEAESLATALVEAGLAACVNLTPVRSIYTWQGQLQSEPEWQLIIKTQRSHFAALETKVRELHSYEVPEVLAVPLVAGSAPYLNWLGAATRLWNS